MSGTNERIELKVGVLVIVCSILLVGFLVLLGKFRPGQEAMVTIDFDTSGGLRIGAPVKLAGIDAGKVEDVEFRKGEFDEDVKRPVFVRVTISMKPELRASLREDARFYITTEGLLGEQYIEIEPGRADHLLANKPVEGIPPMRLEIMTANLNKIATLTSRLLEDNEENIRFMIQDLRAAIKAARALTEDAQVLVGDARKTMTRLEGKAGTLIDTAIATLTEFTPGKGATGNEIKRATTGAADLVESTQKVFGDGKLIRDVVGDTRRVLKKAGGLADRVNGEVGRLGKKANTALDTVNSLIAETKEPAVSAMKKLDTVLTDGAAISKDIKGVMTSIRKGEGSVGAALSDRELFDDVRELMKDLRRHPWKVLWKE